jgi:hypothetical protein
MFDTFFDPRILVGDGIPPHLDEMAPGPALAAFLSSVDVNTVSGYDRVVMLRAHQRMASHYQAHVYTDMAAVTAALDTDNARYEEVADDAAGEIRAALNLTRRAADTELSFALDLHERLPQVHGMLMSGVIDVRRAKTIDRGTCHLPMSAARSVVERIAQAAPALTTGELAASIGKLCIEADPHDAKKRYESAVEGRRVVGERTVDGTANLLGTDLAPDRVAGVTRRINQIARSLRGGGETRTMDQIRADVFLDLLDGTQHKTSSSGAVHLTVDLDTLAGLADHPGELNGFVPVISDIARHVASQQPDTQWRYTITDIQTGEPLHTGTTQRRPTASQRRTVEARDQTCLFPGCRMPAADCDLDHRTSWAEGGPTVPGNLEPLCRPDHRLKHAGWTLQRLTQGRYRWTSRLGHTYTTRPRPP